MTKFIVEYPLEEERIQQHLSFLLKNLEYFDYQGRLSILYCLTGLIEQFPQQLLDEKFAESIFF